MKQKTAVEWLEEKITKKDCGDLPMYVYNAIEKAKEMEKEWKGYSEEDILINIELVMIQGLTLGEYRDLLIEQFKKK
jgi:uncharacterized protein YacL (UPF0231 family)